VREGALNTVASAVVKTTGKGSAELGRDYSEVNTTLVFPFGVSRLTVSIPVRTEYLSGEGSFGLELTADSGCELGSVAAATVTLDGTYKDKQSLLATQSADASDGELSVMATNTTDKNNLSTYKTLDSIDLSKPFLHGAVGSNFSGHDGFIDGLYRTMWKGKGNGTVGVVYELTDDDWKSFYFAGAEVTWWRSYGCSTKAYMKIAIAGKALEDDGGTAPYAFDYGRDANNTNKFKNSSGNHVFWYPYDSNRDFDFETRYVYPHENAIIPEKQGRGDWHYGLGESYAFRGDHPQAIEILNIGLCKDCSLLHIFYIKPILRPFQVNLLNADKLYYLNEHGKYEEDTTSTATDASIVGVDGQGVYFMNDTFTVETPAKSNVVRYSYLQSLDLRYNSRYGERYYTLASNYNPAVNPISYKLNTENMKNLISYITTDYRHGLTPEWANLLKKNDSAKRPDGYATYADYQIKPRFNYINASVTLRNPYDFPITMTISGTDYTLAAKETRAIKAPGNKTFHMGDTLAVTKISLGEVNESLFSAAGVHIWTKTDTAKEDYDDDIKNFTTNNNSGSQNPIYISGVGGRLNYPEVIIEPYLQDKENKIMVRVKTSDLAKFMSADAITRNTETVSYSDGEKETVEWVNTTGVAGVLASKGRVDGEYVYFTFADTNQTFNGKLYAITATPLDDDTVATWYDANTLRTYVGNTFYFTAGGDMQRNIITLSAEKAKSSVTLQGTLRYTSYNLLAGYAGSESNAPALGAVLSAGSAGGVANSGGFVSAGPIAISGEANRYIRYMVSVNGTDLVRETLLPVSSGKNTSASTNDSASAGLLWDFNSNNSMSSIMGTMSKHSVAYSGEKDAAGNDYYVFTATGSDPYLSIDTPVENADDIKWVKIRAKNVSGADKLELFALRNDQSYVSGNSNVQISLKKDNEWHEYVFNLQEINKQIKNLETSLWTGRLKWLRLDPMQSGEKNGSKIYIDYVAFFNNETAARNFRNGATVTTDSSGNSVIDISANFPNGVSPVSSDIFNEISISGTMHDGTYQIAHGAYIPIDLGNAAEMTVKIFPQDYSYTITGDNGKEITQTRTEKPKSIQFVVYDANDELRGVYDVVDKYSESGGFYIFNSTMEFMASSTEQIPKVDENGNEVKDEAGNTVYETIENPGLVPEPGDKLYLRLVTDRLAQANAIRKKGDTVIDTYRYSDVFTGYYFYESPSYKQPPVIGIDDPITIEYGNLPLIGSTGMSLNFPFVNIGIMKIHNGYRIYFGVSPVQIADTVKGTHMSSMSGSEGQYWKDLFSIKHPFDSFFGGLGEASQQISEIKSQAKEAAANGEKFDSASLGSPSWKFDISIGMYFDFHYCTITQGNTTQNIFKFDGLGGYVSVTLGFSMAWYFILPVVFLPAYIGIEIQGTVMGFLGATFNSEVNVSYDDSMNGSANVNDGITEINGGIRGCAYVQLSLGVGLCGTLGVRASGKVQMIANWEPKDPNGSWGFYVDISAGLIIDLFLFSIPLMYTFPGWPFGSFEYYANSHSQTYTSNGMTTNALMSPSEKPENTFKLRESRGDSVWTGSDMELMGAFAPNKQLEKVLVENAYERPDAQLITLSDGETLVLAFLDTDDSKGKYERTTLKMATYRNNGWSEPVIISNDKTGDFQPSIGEMKDGRILVSWVSTSLATNTDLGDNPSDEEVIEYLNSADVYAAFIELDSNKNIKTKKDGGITVADAEVTRISNDIFEEHYDANPTVVCDMVSGDAIVYYVKSSRDWEEGAEIGDLVNPYTNDSVVCYMVYNAEADIDRWTDAEGHEQSANIPAGWLFKNYYRNEMDHDISDLTPEQAEFAYDWLISLFGGQRFLDGPVNTQDDRYAIPDITAIGYDGKSVCAYTIDPDGSNDTSEDKEIYFQVYDFGEHKTKCQIAITDDEVADAMPQFFRSKVNTGDGDNTHTKLFWYRDGKQVVYIDVSELLNNGINYGEGQDTRGSLKTETNGGAANEEYTFVIDYKTHYRYTEPHLVFTYTEDKNSSAQSADFRAVEDSKGNLYVIWTEGVEDEEGNVAREIFGTGLVYYDETFYEAQAGSGDSTESVAWTQTESQATSGWSKPYRITREGYNNDELAVAMSGENLIVVHNRFSEELVVPETSSTVDVEITNETENKTATREAYYNGEVDFMPIRISDMCLVSEALEPCGSVETENIVLYSVETISDDSLETQDEVIQNNKRFVPVTLPMGDSDVSVEVTVSNNGMNIAQGYKLSLYAVDKSGAETLVGVSEESELLAPNRSMTYSFDYTLPADIDGLRFKAVAQEMKDKANKIYYTNTDTFLSDALEAKAEYEITNITTYQAADGFHAAMDITNVGNAPSAAGEQLTVELKGPANLAEKDEFKDSLILYQGAVSLGIGETKNFDVPVKILPAMLADYGFITALITVQKEYVAHKLSFDDGSTKDYMGIKHLSNMEYVDFDLVKPIMLVGDVSVAVGNTANIYLTMDLSDKFRASDSVTYAVDDLEVAMIQDGKVLGVAPGTTTLHATHAATGATVSSTVTVRRYSAPSDTAPSTIVAEVSGDEGSVTVAATVKDNTAAVTAPTEAQLQEIIGSGRETGSVTIDLSTLPENITAVSVPAETVKAINDAMESGAEGLTIKLPNSSVTFDSDALGTIAEEITGGELTLSLEPIEETALTAEQQEALSDMEVHEVYDIFLTDGSTRISNFGGKATVEIKLKDEQKRGSVSVWYVADNGGKEKLPTIRTAKTVKFTVKHFSNYVIANDDEKPADCPKDDSCPLNFFADLDKTAWYHDGVHWALKNGVMNGVSDTAFSPNGLTSRAMLVTMLHRMEGEPTVNNPMAFTDVENGAWYTEAIRWAAANEIVTGYGDGRFGPNDTLTREQLAAILYRYAKTKGQGFKGLWAFRLGFDDASEVSDWAYEAMCWMNMQGIIQGTSETALSPKGKATRAQVATMLMRYVALE
jgi:hypothetical protein